MSILRLLRITPLAYLVLCLVGCFSSSTTPPPPKAPELHEIVLDEVPPEEPGGGDVFSGSRHSHKAVLDEIDRVVATPMIKGVFLRVSSFGGAWARAADLRSALKSVRAAKKPVHCHFDNADNVAYALLADSCDQLSMSPTGLLSLTGVQAETIYAKDLLDLVGLQAELLQVGRFKGAADPLTRSSMPSEVREVLDRLVDDLQASLTHAVTTGRHIEDDALRAAVDSGPHTSQTALDHKLIDAIAFEDEAREQARVRAQAERVVRVLDSGESADQLDLTNLLRALLGRKPDVPTGTRICLAFLSGMISDDPHQVGGSGASGAFISAMQRIALDPEIRAVVLRINSPGGSALASDKMWHAVRNLGRRKPVIVSIGDLAASGGYYVASAGNEIYAQPESIVGSIGVVGGKIVGEKLADKLGVQHIAVQRGRNAGWGSPFRSFSSSERQAVERAMHHTYDTFLARITEGRRIDPERLAAVAEGRIMTGQRAQTSGLIDKLGGLPDAIARALSQGGLKADAPIEIWPRERSVLERATSLFSSTETESHYATPWLAALPELAQGPVVSAWLRGDLSPLAALPYTLRVE